MNTFLAFVVGLIIGGVVVYLFAGKGAKEEDESESAKELAKVKILEELRGGELSNEDIRKLLGISDRTVVRYMDELEEEGKVVQVGKIGRNVVYKLRK